MLMQFPSKTEKVLANHIPFIYGIHCTFSGSDSLQFAYLVLERKYLGDNRLMTMTLI